MNVKTKYKTALYLRLSREDVDIDGIEKHESNSISNQRDLLRSFVQKNEELELFDIYIDDGYSGASFDRPEFKRMMDDVYAGKVTCIVVKDLARFGREYIEAGRLIQKTFPAFNVRFIAVVDGYDTLNADRTESEIVLPVKNFINDSYCRDTSIKVKGQQRAKREAGKFISAFPTYGYLKDPKDRNRLIVDTYAGDIVRKIFSWKIAGMSFKAIAEKLNLMGILSPMEYKHSLGMNYKTGFMTSENMKWSAVAVKRILENRIYTGDMVQGKSEKINYKVNKVIKKPMEEWVCVENMHEAIIPRAIFDIVQELLVFDGRASEDTGVANLFYGILTCADCKTPMIKRVNAYKGKKKVFYICQTKNKSRGCSRHSIEEEKLKTIIFSEISKVLDLMQDTQKVIDYLQRMDICYEQVIEYDTQISRLYEEYKKYHDLKSTLLIDLREGLIDRGEFEEFHKMYSVKCDNLEQCIDRQKQLIKSMFQNGIVSKVYLDELKKTTQIKELSRELLVLTIKRIYVYEDGCLDIVFRFEDELKKIGLLKQIQKTVCTEEA